MALSEFRQDVTSEGDGRYRNSSNQRSDSMFASRACVASAMNCWVVPW